MDYLAKMIKAHQVGTIRAGQAAMIEVRHDDWCPALHGGGCACNAVVVLDGREILEDGTLGDRVAERG
jgi:hypothetical protein